MLLNVKKMKALKILANLNRKQQHTHLMLVKLYSSSVFGITATTITVEVNIDNGLNFYLVGLPDNAVKESQQRIRASFKNNGFHFPGKEITVNLAPADIRKEGSVFDLPIALGILAASNQLRHDSLSSYLIVGELSLDGSLQATRGVLAIALQAREEGFKGIIVPENNASEAAVIEGLEVYGLSNLTQVVNFLNDPSSCSPAIAPAMDAHEQANFEIPVDFKEVKGQFAVKRAFEIAAAGGHNIILIGPPGSGKSMLAKRFPTLLPSMSLEEALETTKIHSVAGKIKHTGGLIRQRPFRKPHHTISDIGLIGGGSYPQPGEISLAHNGVLFLDELPEYKRTVLEVLRQPLEDRTVSISRAKFSIEYPAGFMLIAAMNPCPCGYLNHPEKGCSCGPGMVDRYLNKISGPLLDRIDMHIEVQPVKYDELTGTMPQEDSRSIRGRVETASSIQKKRYKSSMAHNNAQMSRSEIESHCVLDESSRALLKQAMVHLGLSARAYDRILKVARTIADLEGSSNIQTPHVAEAIQYRSLDKSRLGA